MDGIPPFRVAFSFEFFLPLKIGSLTLLGLLPSVRVEALASLCFLRRDVRCLDNGEEIRSRWFRRWPEAY